MVAFMFYYITIYLYIPFGVFPLPCLFCLLLPSELQTYAVLLFSLRGFATAYLRKIATVFLPSRRISFSTKL